jgi:PAB-dependent poly(A)-specific ribonuclease subunit 3
MYDTPQDMTLLQQEDLAMFGRLIFALCCNNLAAMNNASKALETLGRQYSSDMKNVALFLVSKPGPHKVRSSQVIT